MEKNRIFYRLFLLLAVLLSDIGCLTIGYDYAKFLCGGQHLGWSAPASITLLLAIPYGAGILACLALAFRFHRKLTAPAAE